MARPSLQPRRQCTMDDLRGMILPVTDDWEARIKVNEQRLVSTKDGALKAFYARQNETLGSFLEVDRVLASSLPRDVLHTFNLHEPHRLPREYGALSVPSNGYAHRGVDGGEEEPLLGTKGDDDDDDSAAAAKDARWERWGLNLNIFVNLLLLAFKGAASLASSSLSILASAVDSALDVLSTAIIWGTSRAAASKRKHSRSYPTGKKRFEPLGILIFSVLQIATFSQVFLEAITRLIDKEDSEIVDLSWFGKGVILFTIAIKLFIWVVTRSMKSSGVAALAQDAVNDVYFNTASLLFPWLGAQLRVKQLDPIGGALLSLYVITQWSKTLLENFANLSGRVADEGDFSRVLYLVSRFNKVEHVSSLEIYHAGEELVVEVDVCLPPDTSLHLAHDIGEVMQTSIEALDNVSRAFVHLDYDFHNPQAHLSRDEQRALNAALRGVSPASSGAGSPALLSP